MGLENLQYRDKTGIRQTLFVISVNAAIRGSRLQLLSTFSSACFSVKSVYNYRLWVIIEIRGVELVIDHFAFSLDSS